MGPGTPLAALQWDFALLDMELRIWIEKVMMLYVRNLDDNSLAKKVYIEQKYQQWPGLVIETETICQKLKIESVHTTKLRKQKYRKIVVKACHQLNEQYLRNKANG